MYHDDLKMPILAIQHIKDVNQKDKDKDLNITAEMCKKNMFANDNAQR